MSRPLDRPGDDAARERAQTEFDHPVAVEAGAGTGKTTVLVARVLAWCLGVGWTRTRDRLRDDKTPEPTEEAIATAVLEGLVAITFTEAAAAQMARRVAQALATVATKPGTEVVGFYPDLLPSGDSDLLAVRAKALIGALDRLAIRTIHSHCWHLLTTYPLAAGLSPDLEVDADGRHLEEVVRETVETAIKGAYSSTSDSPLRTLAIRGGVDPRTVAAAVVELVQQGAPSVAFESDPLSPHIRRRIRQRLLDSLTDLDRLARPLLQQSRARKDLETAEALGRSCVVLATSPEEPDLDSMTQFLALLRKIWTEDSLNRLTQWSRGDLTQTVTKLLGEFCDPLQKAAQELLPVLRLYRRLDPEILDAGRKALGMLVEGVEQELRARGVVTYSTLMTEAWKLLNDHPAVLVRERQRVDQLLVDEFQDTDRLQCDLVRFLALGGDKTQRPGLFVVGDPKQSIYGWRDADLQAYEDFLDDLHAARGTRVTLDTNFRSAPSILDEVDRVIEQVMQPERGLQPAFASLVPSEHLQADKGFQRADRAPIEYWVSWTESGAQTRAEDAAQLEARAIASDIRELHDKEAVPWNDFGLLLRSTSRLETFLGAFRKAKVPFVVTSDKHYFRRREIIEAAALVRTVMVPVDHLALVTFLRSATVGVPDAALLPLWRGRFPELVTGLDGPASPQLEPLRQLVRAIPSTLSDEIPGIREISGWENSLIAALENLAYLRESFARDPADRFIDQLRQRFLFDATESARHLGIYRLANLDRFFRDLERSLEERDGDTQGVLRALRRSVAESQEAEQALPEGATDEAVQVMTIHGAKGLEFGHVYLPQLHSSGRRHRPPEIRFDRRWTPGQDPEYVLFGVPTPGFDRVETREAEIERTEQVRTLYVAMTRARERLVLLGNWPAEPGPVVPEKRTTNLDLLRSRPSLPLSLQETQSSCRTQKRSHVDHGGARWRFPFLDAASTDSAASAHRKTGLPPIKTVRQQSARLEKARRQSLDRMARRFSGAASDEAGHRLDRLASDEMPFDELASGRELALPVGSAFHRMLETWRLGDDPTTELSRQREVQHRWLATSVAIEQVGRALDRFDALIDRFSRSQFLQRFADLDPDSIAREVPVAIAPQRESEGPVGYVSGFIDLAYQDPESGDWVVVDYKTDRVETESDIADRALVYASQEAIYAQALQESLDLQKSPRTQLWFIWPDYLWESSDSS